MANFIEVCFIEFLALMYTFLILEFASDSSGFR